MSEIDKTGATATNSLTEGWYFTEGGEAVGPCSRGELQTLLASRSGEGVSVWHSSLTGWTPVSQSIFNPVPPVLPPPIPVVATAEPIEDEDTGFWDLLLSFRGRVARWRYVRYYVVVAMLYVVLVFALLGALHLPIDSPDAIIVRVLLGLPFFWIGLALTAKRLHDLDLAAWHLLWIAPTDLAPNLPLSGLAQVGAGIASLAFGLLLFFKRGTKGPNRFGRDPLGAGDQPPPSPIASAPSKKPVRTTVLTVLGIIGLIGVGALGLAGIMDASTPACGDQGVAEKVKQIVARSLQGDVAAVIAGGVENIDLTFQDARTLSNFEPTNGRTCVATVSARTKPGAKVLAAGDIGQQEVKYTVQNVDGRSGRYVVTVGP